MSIFYISLFAAIRSPGGKENVLNYNKFIYISYICRLIEYILTTKRNRVGCFEGYSFRSYNIRHTKEKVTILKQAKTGEKIIFMLSRK